MSVATPSYIFSGISIENLQKIAKQEGIQFNQDTKKNKLTNAIASVAVELGVHHIVQQLKLEELLQITESLDIDLESGGNNPKSKSVLSKRLKEFVIQEGVEEFFSKYADESASKSVLAAADEKPAGKTKKELATEASRAVYFVGLQIFLNRFDVAFLRDLMKDMKLKCTTENKSKIVLAIATQTAAKAEKRDAPEITFSKKKLPIEEGITYQDIFQHYLKEELVEYCEENGLKVSGKKSEVIKRILAFLDDDLENTKATNTKKTETAKSPKSSPKKVSEKKSAEKIIKKVSKMAVNDEDDE